MRTKLLKKMRKEAHHAYCIKNRPMFPPGFETPKEWEGVYVIGLREFSNKQDVVEFKLKDAKKRLHRMRVEYCLKRISDMRESCRITRYNRL